ncbi:hypothetical protein TNCV_620071 [Trichonephila clavipes]|nr:hypothetical protein TNCV_620071 [Trichonephila clavipes]
MGKMHAVRDVLRLLKVLGLYAKAGPVPLQNQLTYRPKFSVFEEYNRIHHLTGEIIRFMILLRLSRERDQAPFGAETMAWVQLDHALRRLWYYDDLSDMYMLCYGPWYSPSFVERTNVQPLNACISQRTDTSSGLCTSLTSQV